MPRAWQCGFAFSKGGDGQGTLLWCSARAAKAPGLTVAHHPPAMTSIPVPLAAAPKPDHGAGKNPLSPKKLLLTKWTAVTPRQREKHFVVLRVIEPEPPSMRVEQVELQAVHSGQVYRLHWRELTDTRVWRQGWL